MRFLCPRISVVKLSLLFHYAALYCEIKAINIMSELLSTYIRYVHVYLFILFYIFIQRILSAVHLFSFVSGLCIILVLLFSSRTLNVLSVCLLNLVIHQYLMNICLYLRDASQKSVDVICLRSIIVLL